MFKTKTEIVCAQCNNTTVQLDQTNYIFTNQQRYLIIRLNNFIWCTKTNAYVKLNSKITEYDTENILIKSNELAVSFRIISAIAHKGASNSSGHYVIWTRKPQGSGWLRISDNESRAYPNLINNLSDIYLLFLEKK